MLQGQKKSQRLHGNRESCIMSYQSYNSLILCNGIMALRVFESNPPYTQRKKNEEKEKEKEKEREKEKKNEKRKKKKKRKKEKEEEK